MEEKVAFRADRLRAARINLGLSQRQLSLRCGFSDASIRVYEAGISDPTSYSLKVLAENLNLSADYLLGLTDDPQGRVGGEEIDSAEQLIIMTYRHEGWVGLARLSVNKIPDQ